MDISATNDREKLVREAAVVITTTPSQHALIEADWLHPGLHITAMGSDSPEKNELDPRVLLRADRLVVDRVAQSIERGEMRSAIQHGLMDAKASADELCMLCAGNLPGRINEHEITLCDLTGTGIQDTAVANYAQAEAARHKLGTVIDS